MSDTCYCCGGPLTAREWVRLNCHPEVVICDACLDWLNMQREGRADQRATIRSHDPTFHVADVPAAVAHYKRLGFHASWHDDEYAFASRDDATIHLSHDPDRPSAPASVYLHVDDADLLADEWRTSGVEITGPADTDYGKYEGSHTDPDGNLIRFGSPAAHSG